MKCFAFFLVTTLAACGGRSASLELSGRGDSARAGTDAEAAVSPDTGDATVSTPDASGHDAEPDGALPSCSWPTPVLPPDAGPFEISANRTVLLCGMSTEDDAGIINYVDPTICLSASATECTAVGIYDDSGGGCFMNCSPCMMGCDANDYVIAVGEPPGGESPLLPLPAVQMPRGCRESMWSDFYSPYLGMPESVMNWHYYCCPCE
jgi:hypothetical protein